MLNGLTSGTLQLDPTSEGGNGPSINRDKIEGMTYGDLIPYLEGSVSQVELGLLRVAQLARSGDLNQTQIGDAVSRAVDFIDSDSGARSDHSGIRVQAVLALEMIASNPGTLAQLESGVRERAFSVLSTLPMARLPMKEDRAGLRVEFSGAHIETNPDVRLLCERVAGLYAPSHRPQAPEASEA